MHVKFWFAIPLWQRVIAALVLGVITGIVWGPGAESIKMDRRFLHRLRSRCWWCR